MTALIKHYDIHGLVSITVQRSAAFDLIPDLSRPFRYFQVANLDRDPDIILEVGDFEPDNQGCYLVDHQLHVRENYLYCEDAYRTARWRVEINGFERGQTRIRFTGTCKSLKKLLAPGMLPESLLLKQVLAFHLSRKGYFLIHGAAASKNGQTVILFGRGGAYKTTILMNLLRQNDGWLMMGDDLAIVGKGQVLSFPAWAGFFAFRYKRLPTEALSLLNRIHLLFFLANYRSIDLPVIDKGQLSGLVHCTVGASDQVHIEELRVEKTLSQLVTVSATEDHISNNIGPTSAYPRYVEAYTYVFPDNLAAKRWRDATIELQAQTQNVPSLALSLPRSPKPHHISEAVRALEGIDFSPDSSARREEGDLPLDQTGEASS